MMAFLFSSIMKPAHHVARAGARGSVQPGAGQAAGSLALKHDLSRGREGHRKLYQPPDEETRPPAQLRFRYGKLKVLHPAQHRAEKDLTFQAGEGRAEAEVHPVAEAEVRGAGAADIEMGGIGEHA